MGSGHPKSRSKKAKEAPQMIKKSSSKLESLCDVERALCESKDSASAVSVQQQQQLCYSIIRVDKKNL